ncbi:hypothetical protein GCM10010985_59300 [Caballeronia grimmiae]|uniref:Uncharacterized protein n=1 Tax=Caballeronia grimmiae TaxID=1071679 RepID=A0ABQ1S6L9_9BURK|nr:hypothetical protein GCM10010985_59300 [Caballeronia grimmiae]
MVRLDNAANAKVHSGVEEEPAVGIADLDASLHPRLADDAKNGARLDAALPQLRTSTSNAIEKRTRNLAEERFPLADDDNGLSLGGGDCVVSEDCVCSPRQLRDGTAQDRTDPDDIENGDVALTSFDFSHVTAVNLSRVS